MPFGLQVQVPTQALEDRIVAAFVGFQGPIPLDDQGLPASTQKQFATRKLTQYVKDVVAQWESQVATNAVCDAARAKATDDFKNV